MGGGIKRIIPLDLGGGLAASGVLGEYRRSGLLPWAFCGGRWASGGGLMSGMPENLLATEVGLEKS